MIIKMGHIMKKKPIDFGRLHVQTKPCVPYCMAIYSVSVIVKNHVRLIIHWVGVLSTPPQEYLESKSVTVLSNNSMILTFNAIKIWVSLSIRCSRLLNDTGKGFVE